MITEFQPYHLPAFAILAQLLPPPITPNRPLSATSGDRKIQPTTII
jgi:hypothetical protein